MKSLYFYDLETTGTNARTSRIMQFAGQRTDLKLNPLGEPDNILVKLSDDILPEPEAILITGITPQATQSDGIAEAEFLKYFTENIAIEGTVFTGFNSVRFDDEFMRFLHYRNFYDAYEWSWKDQRSRWDILDLTRMTRALRPEGIEWPFAPDGKPSNRLELLSAVNKLEHDNAHDALSDVMATIAVTRMIKNKQPKLFDYLFGLRNKNAVKEFVEANNVFVYTSGKYPNQYSKTTVVKVLGDHPGKQGSLVYDLRRDPDDVIHMSPPELAAAWHERVEDETMRFPVKTLQHNRCPAVAPLNVLDASSIARLKLDQKVIAKNKQKLINYPDFYAKLIDAIKILDKNRQTTFLQDSTNADTRLYDGFFGDHDKVSMSVVRAATSDEISTLDLDFQDDRLNELLPLYKARNYRAALSLEETSNWDEYRVKLLLSGGNDSALSKYFAKLNEISTRDNLKEDQRYLLEELKLWAESIVPLPEG